MWGEMMRAILTYNNTKRELEIAQAKLENLIDKKNLLHDRFLGITSKQSETGIHSSMSKDRELSFIAECDKINKDTGMSLNQELKLQKEYVDKLNKTLDKMTSNLLELQGIEYELYSQLVVKIKSHEKNNITRAVEKTAEIYNVDVSTVWRVYNKKIKKIIKCQ
ncbi:MAG TPA: hypothetical protein IAB27_05275 [Candidatus Coprosoma intestinipullorum]|uniref:Uncharacterized protein n=1 Tax=Candidatus Coprosoma intestinipullorum TaxID=2840752 RepID=A0A9D0ZRJ2_9FIRM|nr:hypothetical protein [Candidatus Coprosoma intestinipullorum]